MWTAAKRAAAGLPTLGTTLKFTCGLLGFSVLCANFQRRNEPVPWAGDLKKKTWSSGFDKKDETRTYETYMRTDPETGYSYPVGVIRKKRKPPEKPASYFQLIDSDSIGWETATWESLSVQNPAGS